MKRFLIEDSKENKGGLTGKRQIRTLGMWITESTEEVPQAKVDLNPHIIVADLERIAAQGYDVIWNSRRSFPQSTSLEYNRKFNKPDIGDIIVIKSDRFSRSTEKKVEEYFVNTPRSMSEVTYEYLDKLRSSWSLALTDYDRVEEESLNEYKKSHPEYVKKLQDREDRYKQSRRIADKPWIATQNDI